MEIIIPFPNPNNCFEDRTYTGLKGYLKQLELAVHHAQKSVEHFEKDNVLMSEDSYIQFQLPMMVDSLKDNGISSDTIDAFMSNEEFESLQNVELKIVIV